MKKTKVKKISIILIITIFLISFSAIMYATNAIIEPTTITFTDGNLYNTIKKQLSAKKIKYNGNDVSKEIEISKNDVTTITDFNLQGMEDAKITELSGLENFTGLLELDLSGNAITSMKTISKLTQLQKLNMSENPVNTDMLETIKQLTALKELDMSNTKMTGDQLDYFSTLSNLQTLILAKNNISKVEGITGLGKLTKLDLSSNSSFTSFEQLSRMSSLTDLNVSGTGITSFYGISSLTKLQKLYAADNAQLASIDDIFEKDKNTKEIYLKDLRVLNLNSMGTADSRLNIRFTNLALFTNLEELHLASNELTSLSGISQLENLDYLDLADNLIQSSQLKNFIQYETVDKVDVVKQENTLKATKIDLRGNELIDISMFYEYPGDIKWLDLSENHIYNILPLTKYQFSDKNDNGKTIYLQNQDVTFGIYQKSVEVDHYIILPNIITRSLVEGNFTYDANAKLEYSGVTLNTNYTNPAEYNVRISYTKTNDDYLAVKLVGGNADGTVLKFAIGENGNVGCKIESLLFEDENLDAAIYSDITTKYSNSIKYSARVPQIININQDVISRITELDLQHTSSNADTKIQKLTGLENFTKLDTVYLQDNDVQSIEPIASCVKMQNLSLANNPNLGDNNNAIQNMTALTTLDLSNTGMTNIDCINNLTKNLKDKRQKNKLIILNISNNGLNDVDGIEQIDTLQKLYMANEKLSDEKISKISNLTALSTLNISGNNINNINVISALSELKYFYFNNNQVSSLEPIRGKVFYELEFSANRVKDISPLSSHRTINNLKANNNKIEDVTILNNIQISSEQILSLTGQKLVRTLAKGQTGQIEVDLPQIFIAAHQQGNKMYTSTDFILTNCEMDSTGNKVLLNLDELGGNIAQVEISGGKANGTVLTIAPALEGKITYNPSNTNIINKDVVATIEFNRGDVTIINNDGKNTYTFTHNGEFTFEFTDKYGFEGQEVATVQNIDKKAPVAKVTQVQKDQTVEVTIDVDEEVAYIDGWTTTGNADGTIKLTKTFTEDTVEEVELVDKAGNVTTVKVKVEIKTVSDVITSTTLKVSEDELQIKKINLKTTVASFKQNLVSEMEYEVLDKKGNKLSYTSNIGTGCQVKMQSGKIYTVIVWGDLNGDGQISLTELARVSKIYAKKVTPSDIEKSAIDINMNGKFDLTELAAMSKMYAKN